MIVLVNITSLILYEETEAQGLGGPAHIRHGSLRSWPSSRLKAFFLQVNETVNFKHHYANCLAPGGAGSLSPPAYMHFQPGLEGGIKVKDSAGRTQLCSGLGSLLGTL